MANKRASLVVQQLEDLHVDLPVSRERTGGLDAPDMSSGAPVAIPGTRDTADASAAFPSLAGRAKREELVMCSIRLPVNVVRALDELKRTKGVVPAEFMRDCVAAGLKTVGAI